MNIDRLSSVLALQIQGTQHINIKDDTLIIIPQTIHLCPEGTIPSARIHLFILSKCMLPDLFLKRIMIQKVVVNPICFMVSFGRVVAEILKASCRKCPSRYRTIVVLPAPEGAVIMSN